MSFPKASLGLETFPVRAREHPHGLRCARCSKVMVDDGTVYEQEYATRLLEVLPKGAVLHGEQVSSIVEIVCLECAVKP